VKENGGNFLSNFLENGRNVFASGGFRANDLVPAAKSGYFAMFDSTDRRILNILQIDGETPVADIAERVGLSTSPCWRRIKRMEETGLIAKRVVLVDRRLANVPVTIFISVRAPRHSIDWSEAFRQVISEFPEIVEAFRLTGETDYLLRVIVPSIEVYDQVYKRLIARLEFRDISSSISMEEMKFTTAVPLDYL
jgi:Lrp/AsnC family transcriptional regulator